MYIQNEIVCSVVSSDSPKHLHHLFSEEVSLEVLFVNVKNGSYTSFLLSVTKQGEN